MRKEIFAENQIIFDLDKYVNMEHMFSDIAKVMQILVHNGNECALRYDDCNNYVLEYDSDDQTLGSPQIYWLDAEQVEMLIDELEGKDDDENA